jgi:hypothetical protein
MGHFVSLWDLALARAWNAIETGTVASRPGAHRLILNKKEFETYRKADYFVHIHPQLCLFEDVKFVSGEAFGRPEGGGSPLRTRAQHTRPPAAARYRDRGVASARRLYDQRANPRRNSKTRRVEDILETGR